MGPIVACGVTQGPAPPTKVVGSDPNRSFDGRIDGKVGPIGPPWSRVADASARPGRNDELLGMEPPAQAATP
jgi:hypothetical protein